VSRKKTTPPAPESPAAPVQAGQGTAAAGAPPPDPLAADARLDRRIAWGLFAAAFFALLLTEKPAGFVRDESVYFAAAESYGRWFQLLVHSPTQAFGDDAISRAYDINHEHPALMKNLYGISFLVFHEGLNLLRPAAAFRVPAFLAAALILPLTFLLVRRRFGRAAGVFAAVSFLLVPRQFFEAHLACFDVPMATAWLLVVYCFVQALERPRWWVHTGLAFGLAMATKHNAYFIPAVLIPFSLWEGWKRSQGKPEARALLLAINGVFVFGALLYGLMVAALGPQVFQATFILLSPQTALFLLMVGLGAALLRRLFAADVPTFRAMAPLVAMAALGPAVLYLCWPYLWHHPVDRMAWYLAFHAHHEHYAWFYLGQMLRAPPFPLDYVVVKTALTVPTALFTAMVLGLGFVGWRAWRREATLLEAIIVANAIASIAIISAPNVPHFGGVKHWFPSMPFLSMLAGFSVVRGASGLHEWLKPRLPKLTQAQVAAALGALVLLPGLIATWRVYPYGTSAYAELAGGLPGAATLGMQRQFWANNVTGVLEWINKNARPGDRVYLHECHGGQIRDYQRNGMLRSDLGFVGDASQADIVAYQYHQEFREQEFDAWQALGTTRPATGLYVDETPQIIVYQRPR